MKKILTAAVCAILALSGCTPKTDKAAAAASDFLTAFFDMDMNRAAELCSDEIAAVLRDTVAVSEFPSEEVYKKVVEASRKTTFKIISSVQDEDTGEVEVQYEIYPYGAPKGASIPRTMRLVREDGAWKVVSLE